MPEGVVEWGMFIESAHGGYWNLLLCVNVRVDAKGVYHLVFPVDGGNMKVKPDHPQYGLVAEHFSKMLPGAR